MNHFFPGQPVCSLEPDNSLECRFESVLEKNPMAVLSAPTTLCAAEPEKAAHAVHLVVPRLPCSSGWAKPTLSGS